MAKRGKKPLPSFSEEVIRRLESQLGQGNDLNQRLVEGLSIPAFGPARHLIRPGDVAEQREFYPDRCWAITAMPSFHSWGLFAVFESRSLVRCAFVCRGDMPDKPAADCAVVDCFFEVAEWSDPVLDIVTRGPLAPVPDRSQPEGMMWASCDGIGYVLQVATPDVSATLRFWNPRGSHYRSLERAACDLARRVARVVEHPQVSNFVKTWMSYVRD
jgi:hypothetical protein